MTNKIFIMDETTIKVMDDFFNRLYKSINIGYKKLIVNKKALNIEKYFNDFIDEISYKKINIHDDYNDFETKMVKRFDIVSDDLLNRLVEWLKEKINNYLKNHKIKDEMEKLRITGKIIRVVLIKSMYDNDICKRLAGM